MPHRSPSTSFVPAGEAAALLGVRRASLYAYVSRGRIRVAAHPHDPRARLYSLADVETLIENKARGRRPAAAAASALNWGLPVLETEISRIANGRLFYRGEDAVSLSARATLEDVARLLWACRDSDVVYRARHALPSPQPRTANLVDRAVIALAQMLPLRPANSPVDQAVAILRLVSAAAVGRPLRRRPLHRAIALAWNRSGAADDIRRALVLLADHELNASTFAVRVVASTGASLPACIIAGLAALGGPRHGGATAEVSAVIRECLRGNLDTVIRQQMNQHRGLHGFGHRLYPEGDPRAEALLAACPPPPAVAAILAAGSEATGLAPNVDAALAALEQRHDLPPGAALTLFAIGRTVGWIAHAFEQQATGQLIRPRATYIGPAVPR